MARVRQSATAASQLGAGRGVGAALQVVERRLVGGDQAGLGPGLDRHVAHRHAALHRDLRANTSPRYSTMWPMPPPVPMTPMMCEDHVLGGDAPSPSSPSTVIAIVSRLGLGQGLGGEHVLDLAGADAEGDRPEGAVGGGVGVAAHDGHARLGQALLGADDVHDAVVLDEPIGWLTMPNSLGVVRRVSICLALIGSAIG